jgi:hypothetical protein
VYFFSPKLAGSKILVDHRQIIVKKMTTIIIPEIKTYGTNVVSEISSGYTVL